MFISPTKEKRKFFDLHIVWEEDKQQPLLVLPVSSLDRVQLQKMVKDFKKSGPEVPAFVPDEGDILGGADPLNPLRGN